MLIELTLGVVLTGVDSVLDLCEEFVVDSDDAEEVDMDEDNMLDEFVDLVLSEERLDIVVPACNDGVCVVLLFVDVFVGDEDEAVVFSQTVAEMFDDCDVPGEFETSVVEWVSRVWKELVPTEERVDMFASGCSNVVDIVLLFDDVFVDNEGETVVFNPTAIVILDGDNCPDEFKETGTCVVLWDPGVCEDFGLNKIVVLVAACSDTVVIEVLLFGGDDGTVDVFKLERDCVDDKA